MTFLITMKHVQLIKKELGLNLPHIKSSHRAEAMARGLGWKSNAAFRAALMCGPAECTVDDGAFSAYLTEKGFEGAGQCRFSAVIEAVMDPADKVGLPQVGEVSLPTGQGGSLPRVTSVLNVWGAVAFGLFTVICYMLLTVQTADQYLEREMAQSLDMSEKAAQRSVLILDKDLAAEVVTGLLEQSYVANAEILNDHDERMAFKSQAMADAPFVEEVQSLLTLEGETEYRRALEMPPTLGETPGTLIVRVNRAKALSVLPGPTWGGMILSLLLGVLLVAGAIVGQAAFRAWMRVYLAEHYRLAHS